MRILITISTLLIGLNLSAQFTLRKPISIVDLVLIGGQSNGANFYNSATTGNPEVRWGQRLADSLEATEGGEWQAVFFSRPSTGVHKRADVVDWNNLSVGETYDDFMSRLANYVSSGADNYPGYYINQSKSARYRLLLWVQGESDYGATPDAEAYYNNCAKLFASIRASLREPSLPIVIIKLNDDVSGGGTNVQTVRGHQQSLADNDPYTWIVNIDDFNAAGTDYIAPGDVHYSNTGLQKISDRTLALCRASIF